MGCCDTKEVCAVTAGHEHAKGALMSSPLVGNRDAERGREWMAEVGDPVELRVKGREPGPSSGKGRCELPDGNFDVVEAGLGDDIVFDRFGNRFGDLKLNSFWLHRNNDHQWAECGFFSNVSKAQSHDSIKHIIPNFLEVRHSVYEDSVPGRQDGMVVDRTQFPNKGLGIRTVASFGPGSSCLEDEWGPTEQAICVSIGIRIMFGEAGLVDLEV